MTKMKSKKMTKSTFAVIIMAIVMVAMMAFGGTYAYFTATADTTTATVGTGTIAVKMGSIATISNKYVASGAELLGTGKVTADVDASTNVSTWLFVEFSAVFAAVGGNTELTDVSESVVAGASDKDVEALLEDEGYFAVVYSGNTGSGKWEQVKAGVFAFLVEYNEAGTRTTAATPNVCESIKFYGRSNSHTELVLNEETTDVTDDYKEVVVPGKLMGGTITITITPSAIQAAGFVAAEGKTAAQVAYEALQNQPSANP